MSIITTGQFSNATTSIGSGYLSEAELDDDGPTRNRDLQTNLVTPATDVSTITREFSLDTASTLESIDSTFLISDTPSPINQRTATMKPKEEMYRHLQGRIQRDYFVTWKMPESSIEYTHTWFSSAFVDPISGEVFLSGDLIQHSSRHKDSLTWYTTMREAEDAAVARALDCFDLRNRTPRTEGQRVEESPYLVGDESPLPSSICPVAMRRLLRVSKIQYKLDPSGYHGGSSSDMSCDYDQAPALLTTLIPQAWDSSINPIQVLIKFYSESRAFFGRKSGIMVPKTNYVCWTHTHNAKSHTCAYVCPVFGDIFLSGKLIHNTEDSTRFETKEGVNWYGTKSGAKQAAAGHAHDCLSRRKKRLDAAPQFCLDASCSEGLNSFDDMVQLIPSDQMEQIQELRRYRS
mmetsp:Transcript_14330/g.34728  ORF Transcript_14330/g.34728 Transcript_14330/m.34728 type:complete len:404 (-) Transcript_14330:47-1258(-)